MPRHALTLHASSRQVGSLKLSLSNAEAKERELEAALEGARDEARSAGAGAKAEIDALQAKVAALADEVGTPALTPRPALYRAARDRVPV